MSAEPRWSKCEDVRREWSVVKLQWNAIVEGARRAFVCGSQSGV